MKDVEKAINFIIEQLKVSEREAKRLLHRYICKGLCDWYQSESEVTGFAYINLTEKQLKVIEEAIEKFVEGETNKNKIKRVHQYLCPGEPCSMN